MITRKQKDLLSSLNQRTARLAGLPEILDGAEKVVAVTWDYDKHGGDNTQNIELGFVTPEDCIVTKVVMHVLTAVTGTGSTYTLKFGSVPITDTVDVANMVTGTVDLASSATAIPVDKGEKLVLDIGTADATAGKVRFYVYMLPQRDLT